jgi:archaellum component FlaG (FlaF/FlaG flagellin family)
MAGTAVSEMIFFIAAILVSSAVAVTLIEVIDQYADDVSDNAQVVEGEMRSRMTIINDPLYIPYDTTETNITYYIKNTGTISLSTEDLVVSANGTTKAGSDLWIRLLGGSSVWMPGDTIEVIFRAPNLREGVDYNGWASTSGITDNDQIRGSAQDTIIFQVKED